MKQKINHRGKARTTETQASPRAFHLKPDHIQADTVETWRLFTPLPSQLSTFDGTSQ